MNVDLSLRPFEKLPRWAKDHINHLERKIKSLESARAPHEGSKIIWGYQVDDTLPHGNIPTGSPVRFMINSLRYEHFDCRVDEEDNLIVSGNPSIIIQPEASNRMTVKLVRR